MDKKPADRNDSGFFCSLLAEAVRTSNLSVVVGQLVQGGFLPLLCVGDA
jgi:hypothetical protein